MRGPVKLEWKEIKGSPGMERANAGGAHFTLQKVRSYAGGFRWRLSIFNPPFGGASLINHSQREKVEEYAQRLVDSIRGEVNK